MSRYLSVPFDENKHPIQDVQLTGSNIPEAQAIPYQIVKRKQTTIQTHNQVSVGASTGSNSAWIDCNGFDKVAFTLLNDTTASNQANADWSNDGINVHAQEVILATSTQKERPTITDTKARYVRFYVYNGDTVAHIMSAWAYLKC